MNCTHLTHLLFTIDRHSLDFKHLGYKKSLMAFKKGELCPMDHVNFQHLDLLWKDGLGLKPLFLRTFGHWK